MDKKKLTKLIAFLSMGDGSLVLHHGCVNASFKLTLSERNEDLIDYACDLLDELGVGWKKSKHLAYVTVNSRVHPFLTTLYHRIYPDGRKSPSPHDFKLLDWEAVALLYMCDGNIQKAGKRWYPMLNLCRWNYAELCWVKQQFKARLEVDVNVYKCGKYWRLGVPAKDCDKFFEGVGPYMLESFLYKLPNGEPQGYSLGGDIVRPLVKAGETGRNDLSL